MTFPKPRLALCMIVKNEAHVICEALECLHTYIDYYVISDTGSTDGTKEVIKAFFDRQGIPGEIHDTPWKDFGYNRTKVLELARGKAEYLWMFDADDLIQGKIVFPENMNLDGYMLRFDQNISYQRVQIFKGDVPWIYEGILHEYPKCLKDKALLGIIAGDYCILSRRLGSRNKDPKKYQKDAELLEEELKKDPKNSRYMFYCAQSFMDSQNFVKAEEWYKKRVEASGWDEEVYISMLRIAFCMRKQMKPIPEILDTLYRATQVMPDRIEAYFEISHIFRLARIYRESYEYAKIGYSRKYNPNSLFSIKIIHDFAIKDELALSAYHMGYYNEALKINTELLHTLAPEMSLHRERLEKNQLLYLKKVEQQKTPDKPLLCFYLGYANAYDENSMIYGSEIALRELIQHLKPYYRITLVETQCQHQGEIEPGVYRIKSDYFDRYQESNEIDTLIISRYLCAFVEHTLTAKKVYIWIHDMTFHSLWNTPFPKHGKHLIENIDSRVNGYVALTQWHRELLQTVYDRLPLSKFNIIGNGLSPEKFKMDQIIKRVPYRFIYTSSPDRGLDKLLEYFHEIHKEFPQAELYIYRGKECFTKEYEYLLEEMKKYSYIHYQGRVNHDQLALEFRRSDVWLYPTHFAETYCMSALEAQFAGCVCICSDLAALSETVGDRGILLKNIYGTEDYKQEVLSAVRKVFSMDIQNMRRKAQVWASQQTWKRRALCWKNLIETGNYSDPPSNEKEISFPKEVLDVPMSTTPVIIENKITSPASWAPEIIQCKPTSLYQRSANL